MRLRARMGDLSPRRQRSMAIRLWLRVMPWRSPGLCVTAGPTARSAICLMGKDCRLRRLLRRNNHLQWGRRRLRATRMAVSHPSLEKSEGAGARQLLPYSSRRYKPELINAFPAASQPCWQISIALPSAVTLRVQRSTATPFFRATLSMLPSSTIAKETVTGYPSCGRSTPSSFPP